MSREATDLCAACCLASEVQLFLQLLVLFTQRLYRGPLRRYDASTIVCITSTLIFQGLDRSSELLHFHKDRCVSHRSRCEFHKLQNFLAVVLGLATFSRLRDDLTGFNAPRLADLYKLDTDPMTGCYWNYKVCMT